MSDFNVFCHRQAILKATDVKTSDLNVFDDSKLFWMPRNLIWASSTFSITPSYFENLGAENKRLQHFQPPLRYFESLGDHLERHLCFWPLQSKDYFFTASQIAAFCRLVTIFHCACADVLKQSFQDWRAPFMIKSANIVIILTCDSIKFAYPSGGPLFHPSTIRKKRRSSHSAKAPAITMSKPLPLSVTSRACGAAMICSVE